MADLGKKLIELGLGALVLTKEAVKKTVVELEKQGKIGQKEAQKLFNELIKKGEAAKSDLDKKIQKGLENALKKMNLATKKEVDDLKAEITKLKAAQKKKK
ncbi:MAG: hypothetical protein JW827_11465 [Spirochaetes bacterium]|nr:hypothetical protein [Spirochaetota bacterium]